MDSVAQWPYDDWPEQGFGLDQSEGTRDQLDAVAERWREHGVDIDVADLTYTGDHHDAADYLQAREWETVRATLAELVATAGLAPLEGDDLNGAPTEIFYVNATGKEPAR
jgi:O-methyltransferase involved in polyketide biosynthesis